MTMYVTNADHPVRATTYDSNALAEIYERYSPAIFRYIYYRVGDAELADDLRAEVFLRMLEKIDQYEERGWPISAWLYRIAHDRTVDALRRRHTRMQVSLQDWQGSSESPEHAVYTQLECEELRHTLGRLTDDQRTVIQMRFLQDMSIQDVAHALGRTEGAVKALQHRGIQTLARYLHAS